MGHDTYLAMQIGEYLLARRKELGMSMRRVAMDAGISPSYLSALEKCMNPKTRKPSLPSYDVLQRLSRVLGNEILPLADITNEIIDPLKLTFDQFVIDAFHSGTVDLILRSKEIIETMKSETLKEAEIAYRELNGTALSAYVKKVRNRDYTSEFVRRLEDYRETTEHLLQ